MWAKEQPRTTQESLLNSPQSPDEGDVDALTGLHVQSQYIWTGTWWHWFFVVCFSYLSVFNTSDSEAHVYPTENWLFGLSQQPSVVGAKAVRLDMDYTGKRGKR